jgi:hypothetical protein
MKKLYKPASKIGRKYEMLSAYIDNELSNTEIKSLEDQLKFSKDLQNKLEELKRIKQLTSTSAKTIKENPYFETRLAAAMRTPKPFWVRMNKLIPVLGIVAVSLILMVVLKYNPKIVNKLVEQQKSNLTAFYKQNLKPLLFTANLSNEDIFNFAFNHQLPLDTKKSQYLQLGSDKNGHQFFEIKTAGIIPQQNNLEKFADALKLNEYQKMQMDSILQSYAEQLKYQVLVNEKNTVAINPNIWNFNKALAANLISFASKANKNELAKLIPDGFQIFYNDNNITKLISQVKSRQKGNDKYIFITPDSIFSDSFQFDEKKFTDEMKKWNDKVRKNMNELNKNLKDFNFSFHFNDDFTRKNADSSNWNDFKVYSDSNGYKVGLSKIFIPPINLPDIDSIISNIDSQTGIFKHFSFNFPKEKGKNYKYKYFYNDSSKGYNFNFKAFGFDSTYGFKNPKADSLFRSKFKNFNMPMNPDSFSEFFKSFFNDSTNFNQQKQIQKQLQEFRKEMEQFKKEMEKLQKELKQNSTPSEEKKPIEI